MDAKNPTFTTGTTATKDLHYKKRPGTSGISGHLYETKLISLLSHRLQRDERVQHYYLATNVDEMGAFDDIFLVAKLAEHARPIALFVQVKHKDNDDAFLTLDHKTDLVKWFDSYLKIKNKLNLWMNCLNVSGAECVFILYTNAGFATDLNSKFDNNYATTLNNLISTSDTVGCRPLYSERHIEDCGEVFLKKDLTLLAEHLVTFLCNKTNHSMNIMNDEYILQYHVILRQKIVDVTNIQTEEHKPDVKWRTLTFRRDFFETNEKHLALFREILIEEILKHPTIRNKLKVTEDPSHTLTTSDPPEIDELISLFLVNPSTTTLTPLIITYVTYNENDKLEFVIKRPSSDAEKLRNIIISRRTIEQALYAARTAAIKYLQSLELKVPIAFGNVDLAISGSSKKIDRRLNHLTVATVALCKQYEPKDSYKVVEINDTIDNGLLSCNGGLASAVGNVLTHDEKTKLLMFSKDCTSLQNNAKSLLLKLTNAIHNLHEYRFQVKTLKFPKVHLDCTHMISEFLSELVIYAKQSNHHEVEEIFKAEIEHHLNMYKHDYCIKSDWVFLYYHHLILAWWMSPKTATYLTKTSDLFAQAINNYVAEPQISALHTTFLTSNLKYFEYKFNENATRWLEVSELHSKIFVITDTVILTTVKLISCLRNYYLINNFAVLDIKNIEKLPNSEFRLLNVELRETTKAIIIIWRNVENKSHKFNEIVKNMKIKQLFTITNNIFIKDNVECKYDVIYDDTQSFTAMTLETQRELRKNINIRFQDQEVSLGLIVDDVSVALVKRGILNRLIHNQSPNIGASFMNLKRKEICEMMYSYIDRRVSLAEEGDDNVNADVKIVRTFHDINDDVVLITASPGMGKSTLLTYLSLKTKECDWKLWIVRVNLLYHSKQFYKWHEDGTIIDAVESLRFLSEVALENKIISLDVEITNGKASLVHCTGDEVATFELNLFLHFYNNRRLIIVFDGFDEICPHYKDKVVDLLKVTRYCLRKYKMWVTSRPYSDILPNLQSVCGRYYKLEHFNNTDQEIYLEKIWRQENLIQRLQRISPRRLVTIVENMELTMQMPQGWINRICCIFYNFLHPFLSRLRSLDDLSRGELRDLGRRLIRRYNGYRAPETETLTGVPLLLHFTAFYFIDILKRSQEINMYNIYQMFIRNKIEDILYQQKNKMDLYNPDVLKICKRELTECMLSNKRLAAHALLRDPIFRALHFAEFVNMNPLKEVGEAAFNDMLINIRSGDKIGLISHVTADNVPVFVHRSFTEYFAAEYVCDILKSDKFSLHTKILWLQAILECCSRGVLDWMEIKIKTDKELPQALREIENMDPQPMYNTQYRVYIDREHLSKGQFIRIMCSSVEDYESRCFNELDNKYTVEHFDEMESDVKQALRKEYTSAMINQMKPYLKKHFLTEFT